MDIDNIIIQPKNVDFLELLEKNLNNENYKISNDNNDKKPFRKYTPPPKKNIEIIIPQKSEIKKYRYYTDNFKKKKKTKNKELDLKDNDRKQIKRQNTEKKLNNVKNSQNIINDFSPQKNDEKSNLNKTQKILNYPNNKSKENINININKFVRNNSELNKIEYEKNYNNKSHEKIFNSISVKKSFEFNSFNKNKNINQLHISTSINNFIGYSNKNSINLLFKTSNSIKNENNIPDEDMQNDIDNILNLNNNIDISNNKFNTIHNLKHSHSTKSFAFRKRVGHPYKSPISNFDPLEIMNRAYVSKNVLNYKDSEENKINKLEKDINKVKEEFEKVKKEKMNIENLNRIIQSEIRNFNRQKNFEQEQFEIYKNNKIKNLTNERNKISYELQQLNELKKKYEEYNNNIDSNINNNNNYYYEINDNNNNNEKKKIIEIYQKKVEEANITILELKKILNQLRINNNNINKNNINKLKHNNEKIYDNNNNKKSLDGDDDSEFDEDDNNYDLLFPPLYHNIQYNLKETKNDSEGKIINIYDKNKTEIILNNGEKKEIFSDKYEITYFNNGDIKQIFKQNGKQVYFFNKQKTVQTTFKTGLQVLKYDNGQLEKIFTDGTKKIAFPDGCLRYIFPNRLQETYFPDGSVERIDKEGNVILEHEDGTKEIMYHLNKDNLN